MLHDRIFERHTVKSFALVMHLADLKGSEEMLLAASRLPIDETLAVVRQHAGVLEAEIARLRTADAARKNKCRQRVNAYARQYSKRRREANPAAKLEASIRAQIVIAVRRVQGMKKSRTFDTLGYTPQELKDHITAMLRPGMTWENYGKVWHIDHKRPVSWFKYDPNSPSSFISECWALSNLQPLFARENLSKQARYEDA